MRRRDSKQTGQELVEFAIGIPIFLLLILGIIEFSIIISAYETITNAAREATRYGIINPDDSSGMEARARDRAAALEQTSLQVASAHVDSTVRVTVTYGVNLMTGPIVEAFGGSSTVNLRSSAVMNTEAW